MVKDRGLIVAVIALAVFVFGGLATFTGLVLLGFWKNRDIFGLGSGYSMGVSLTVFGLILSVSGVLLMRLVRNRT